jgi:hypothetical protein
MELMLLMLIVIVFAALGVTANEVGVDSRDFSDDPHRSDYPVGMA